MIRSSYRLLKVLLKIVSKDDDEIWIDWENKKFEKVHDATTPDASRPFPSKEPSVSGLLTNLKEEGYIKIDANQEYCSLTYKALYYKQIRHKERIHYFLKSIFVPIVLSLITSVIANIALPLLLELLQGYLRSMG